MPIPLNVKHWNDRADRDLFFTILSVKNIGVISGAEWTVIGNDMRTLGYGFTNEGCRQHFQGLRRSISGTKKKRRSEDCDEEDAADVSPAHAGAGGPGVVGGLAANGMDPARDPARNPITRRPGPGRGRPKKPKQGGRAEDSTRVDGLSAELLAVANGLRPLLPISGGGGGNVSDGSGNGSSNGNGISNSQQAQPQLAPSHPQPLCPMPVPLAHGHVVAGTAVSSVSASPAAGDAGGDDDADGDGDEDEEAVGAGAHDDSRKRPAKRQRLDGTAGTASIQPALPASAAHMAAQPPPVRHPDDDGVLAALAGHSNTAFPDE